jgi:hypothetical protein
VEACRLNGGREWFGLTHDFMNRLATVHKYSGSGRVSPPGRVRALCLAVANRTSR